MRLLHLNEVKQDEDLTESGIDFQMAAAALVNLLFNNLPSL